MVINRIYQKLLDWKKEDNGSTALLVEGARRIGKSLIIFDEIQKWPLARQAIKHLVKDRRFHYIETGSLSRDTWPTERGNRNYEVDFLIPAQGKIDAIEVKSSSSKEHASIDAFIKKFSSRIRQPYPR